MQKICNVEDVKNFGQPARMATKLHGVECWKVSERAPGKHDTQIRVSKLIRCLTGCEMRIQNNSGGQKILLDFERFCK